MTDTALLVLVAGATGTLGRPLVHALATRGWRVRALVRSGATVDGAAETVRGDLRDGASLRAACAGCEAVVSAAGASLALALRPGSPGFNEVDRDGTRRLVDAALAAGVGRIGYASVFHTAEQAGTAYVRAHAEAEAAVRSAGVGWAVLRPTGLFPALLPLLQVARLGVAPSLGGGKARSNPVDPADAAEAADALADAVGGPGGSPVDAVVEAGGPEALTRDDMFRAAFDALGRPARFVPVPPAVVRAHAALARPLDRRLSDVLRFFERASTTDCVAPAVGGRRLEPFFRGAARR